MLSSTAYDQAHVEACRARTERQLAAHAELLRTARAAAAGDPQRGAALDGWERVLAGDVVLALEAMFLHRARGSEKKGGALKEVRERAAAVPAQGADPDALDGRRATALAEAFYAELAQTHVARTPAAAGG